MLNYIWLGLILLAVILGGLNGKLSAVNTNAIVGAKDAAALALGLIGTMAMWLGIMRLAEKSGLVVVLARWLQPVMRRLFPDVPPEHPAMGAMMLNCAANMVGVGDAATPLGLRAMRHLERLNPHPGTATNAMCKFLAINTSSIQLIPASVIALIAAKPNVQNPTAIVGTALLATTCSTIVGITAVKLLEKLRWFAPRPSAPAAGTDGTGVLSKLVAASGLAPAEEEATLEPPVSARSKWITPTLLLLVAFFGFVMWGLVTKSEAGGSGFKRIVDALSLVAMPFMLIAIPLYAWLRGVEVYDEFVEGAKDGFQTVVRIIPYLVAMLVAVGMFRGAGGVDLISKALRPALEAVHFPVELLPLSLMRPLSGSASRALFVDILTENGPDGFLTRTAGTIMGSTETTLYVIMVYFGSVGIRRTRHAIWAGLAADLAGVIASVIICRLVFG